MPPAGRAPWERGARADRRALRYPPCMEMPAGDRDEDAARMLAYARGDEQAFAELYAKHRGGVYRYLLRRCGQRETAEELYQEVFTKVIDARDSYQPTARFTTWLYRLAHNTLVDHLRRTSRRIVLVHDANAASEALPDATPGAAEQHDLAQLREQFSAALSELPPDQLDAFLLHEEGGLTLEQIGDVTGVNRETVKSRLRYALRKLRGALQPAGEVLS